MDDNEPKVPKPSPNRRSRESAMMQPDLKYILQRKKEMADRAEREKRYQPGFRIDPPTEKDPSTEG